MIYIIEHVAVEGPGTIENYLRKKEIPFKTIGLYRGDSFPASLKDVTAVICMGGPMNVYEEDKFPFLKEENKFIQKVLKNKIPYLGVCLGSQLLAKAVGTKVVKSPVKEVGWFNVDLRKEAKNDPLFKDVPPKFDVYHWHEDMFEIPQDGVFLATGDGCPHQAFRIGKNAYGIQFHIEITDRSIKEWSDEYCQKDFPGRKEKCEEMMAVYRRTKKDFLHQAYRVYDNFLRIIEKRSRKN